MKKIDRLEVEPDKIPLFDPSSRRLKQFYRPNVLDQNDIYPYPQPTTVETLTQVNT